MATKDGSQKRNGIAWGTFSTSKLRDLLDADYENEGIVVWSANRIYRRHYAKLLGCSNTTINRQSSIFDEYERKPGIWKRAKYNIPDMCCWVNNAYDARKLSIYGNSLDRSAFIEHFRVPKSFFERGGSAVQSLFRKLDAQAKNDGYIPLSADKALLRLRTVLASASASGGLLGKDRKTLSWKKLEKKVGLTRGHLRKSPFIEEITAFQDMVMLGVKASKIDPFFHGRVFAFSDLTPLWSVIFLERVGARFKKCTAGLAQGSARLPYLNLVKVLKWIGTSTNSHCQIVVKEANELGCILSSEDWEDALYAYRDFMISKAVSERRASRMLANTRLILHCLSTGGVVPSMLMPKYGCRSPSRKTQHLRSIAEASLTNGGDVESKYIVFAREHFLEMRENPTLHLEPSVIENFISSLAVELKTQNKIPSTPDVAIRNILERRLGALRNHATVIFEKAAVCHEDGQRLLASAKIDGAEFERKYLDLGSDPYKRDQFYRENFPGENSNNKQFTQGLANLLGIIHQRYLGVPPRVKGSRFGESSQFFGKTYSRYGGLESIIPLLHPSTDAVCAALTLYLIDTGANISVGRTLDRDCLGPSDVDGYQRITGYKARAKGKAILFDLPDNSPAVRAISWLLSTGDSLKTAANVDSNMLFLTRVGGRVQLLKSENYLDWFKRFVASTPGLEKLSLTPNMLRPSVLLLANLSNDGRLAVGMAIGQHSLSVTKGYQQKWPSRVIYDRHIERFQTAFQTLVMSSVEDAAIKLGLTVDEFEARMGNLKPTGLGTFCADARGRPSETTAACSSLDCWNDCPHLLIVAELESIATLQLWQGALKAVQPEWERDQPKRWEEVWLPWLCLTDVVEEKMARGPLLKLWNKATKRATELSNTPEYVAPKPW